MDRKKKSDFNPRLETGSGSEEVGVVEKKPLKEKKE